MKNSSVILIVPILFILSTARHEKENKSLLIEAESFNDKGGRVVDPQIVCSVGSPYLLAHGMGKPVKDAGTVAGFPETGNYHVWVRTMNWAPGPWEAPGRFRILIDSN